MLIIGNEYHLRADSRSSFSYYSRYALEAGRRGITNLWADRVDLCYIAHCDHALEAEGIMGKRHSRMS